MKWAFQKVPILLLEGDNPLRGAFLGFNPHWSCLPKELSYVREIKRSDRVLSKEGLEEGSLWTINYINSYL